MMITEVKLYRQVGGLPLPTRRRGPSSVILRTFPSSYLPLFLSSLIVFMTFIRFWNSIRTENTALLKAHENEDDIQGNATPSLRKPMMGSLSQPRKTSNPLILWYPSHERTQLRAPLKLAPSLPSRQRPLQPRVSRLTRALIQVESHLPRHRRRQLRQLAWVFASQLVDWQPRGATGLSPQYQSSR